NGGTLAQDITVQVGIIDGTPGFDYPNATITQIVTFKAGTNPTSMPVDPTDGGFVTINHNRASETDIHIQIQTATGNGATGPPQPPLPPTPGRATPTVTTLSPRSGGPTTMDSPIPTQGTNFLTPPQATCPPSQTAGPNAPVAPTAPTA